MICLILLVDSEVGKKIKVEIKPANGTTPTGNVDEIKKSIEGLRLSPTSNVSMPVTMPTDNSDSSECRDGKFLKFKSNLI